MADPVLPGYKKCATCGEVKPVAEFPLRTGTKRPRSPCKKCEAKRSPRKRSETAKAAARGRAKAWREEHPEEAAAISRHQRDRARGDVVLWANYVLIRRARHDAKKQGVACTITGADVQAIYDQQNGRCALAGRGLLFGSRGRQRDSMSLDRIKNGGDYSPENVRLLTYQANMARGMFSDEELFAFCEAVLATRDAQWARR